MLFILFHMLINQKEIKCVSCLNIIGNIYFLFFVEESSSLGNPGE